MTKHTDKLIATIAFGFLTLTQVSCSQEDLSFGLNPNESGAVRVVATVARELNTRAEGETIFVMDGIYNLSYLKPDNETWSVASVDFNKEGLNAPGVGIVSVPGGEELRWLDVGGGATPTFYLDNVDSDKGIAGSTLTEINLGTPNSYQAAVFDEDVNDLLWSSAMVRRNDKNINFDLHHNMSRLRVEVTVDRTNSTETRPLNLDDATVTITSINQVPVSYNRLDGNLTLPTGDEAYSDLKIVNPDDATSKWKSVSVDDTNDLISTYVSVDFVLPPQELLTDQNRPQLIITIPNPDGTESIFSGIIPHAMLVDDDTHLTPSYPVSLSFLKEHILTIRTKITEDPPTLSFMPVTVVKWVDKGEFTTEAHQAGIYTAQEFYNLIAYYKAKNSYQLTRYGKFVEETDEDGQSVTNSYWQFDFFHSVVLDYTKISGQMKVSDMDAFKFSFNGYSVFVTDGNTDKEPVRVTESQLYNIVVGTAGMPAN